MATKNINSIKLPNSADVYNIQDVRIETLLGGDSLQSIRNIANDELAQQLVPENAQVALNTLTEIANWIQNHPESYSAFISQYNNHKHSTSYKPAGSVSKPTFSAGEQTTGGASAGTSVSKSTHTHSGTFTPAGSVSKPTFTGSAGETSSINGTGSFVVNSMTSKGTLPTVSHWGDIAGALDPNDDKCLVISHVDGSLNPGTLPDYTEKTAEFATKDHSHGFTPTGDVSKPSFTGSQGTVSVSATSDNTTVATNNHTHKYTPVGEVSQPTFTGANATIEVGVPDKQATNEVLEDTHQPTE